VNASLLAIDPGAHSVALAVWVDGVLTGLSFAEFRTRESMADWWQHEWPVYPEGSRLLVECPQVYQQRRWKGDPNDLIQVAVTVGVLIGGARGASDILLVRPHEWKGSVPKAVHQARVLGAAPASDRNFIESYCDTVVKRHNVMDAYALGRWLLNKEQTNGENVGRKNAGKATKSPGKAQDGKRPGRSLRDNEPVCVPVARGARKTR